MVIVRRVSVPPAFGVRKRALFQKAPGKRMEGTSQHETPHLKIFMPAVGFADGMRDAADHSACRSNHQRKSKRADLDRAFLCNGELDLQQPAGFL